MKSGDPVDLVLGRLEGVEKAGADSWKAWCPAHKDEKTKSLSVRRGREGKCVLHCFAGCETKAVVEALGLKFSDLFVGDGLKPGGGREKKKYDPLPEGTYPLRVTRVRDEMRNGKRRMVVTFRVLFGPQHGEAVFDSFEVQDERALGRLKFLWTALGLDTSGKSKLVHTLMEGRTVRAHVTVLNGDGGKKFNRIEAASYGPSGETTYDYRDEKGELIYQVVRFGPPAWPGEKEFLQRRPTGSGGWTWSLGDTRRVLYRLEELMAAEKDEPVFFVEGEKDAENLLALGLMATTTAQGARSIQRTKAEEFRVLAARQVVVLPDNDLPGEAYAAAAVRLAVAAGASAKVVLLDGLPPGGDVSDWLAAGGTAARLLELARAAPADNGSPNVSSGLVIANYLEETVETEKGPRKVISALSQRDVLAAVAFACEKWPKRIGGELFADHSGEVWFLEDSPALFAFLAMHAEIRWRSGLDADGRSFIGRNELMQALRIEAQAVDEISEVPLVPEPAGVQVISRLNGTRIRSGELERFLANFQPATAVDEALVRALALTFFWGGAPGQRPLFVITGPEGVGVQETGKTKLVELLASLVGGCQRVQVERERGDDLAKQLCADCALSRRVVLVDNVTGILDSREIAELLTAEEISGRPAFGHSRRRVNRLTWCLTAVSPELDDDLASRSAVIHLATPDRDARPLWEVEVRHQATERRAEIVSDALAVLAGDRHPVLARHSRTPSWDLEVLATDSRVDEVLTALRTRRASVNVRSEAIDLVVVVIEERARSRLLTEGKATFNGRELADIWFEATGQKVNAVWVGRRLRESLKLGRLPSWLEPPSEASKRSVWTANLSNQNARDLADDF